MIAASGFDDYTDTTIVAVQQCAVFRATYRGPPGFGRVSLTFKIPWLELSLARPKQVSVEPLKKDQGVFQSPFSLWAPSGRAPRYGPN
jgi:hypothetical protein